MKTIQFTLRLPDHLMSQVRDIAQRKSLSINTTLLEIIAKSLIDQQNAQHIKRKNHNPTHELPKMRNRDRLQKSEKILPFLLK